MNKKSLIITLIFSSILITSCKKVDNKIIDKLKNDSEKIINSIYINTYSFNNKFKFEYEYFFISDNIISVFDYDDSKEIFESKTIGKLNFSDNINGLLIKNQNKEIYISVENQKYCAIKKFDEQDIKVYKVSQQDKCHQTILTGNELFANITAFHQTDYSIYDNGSSDLENPKISNDNIVLRAYSNVIDSIGCKYIWYRGDQIVKESTEVSYIINRDSEDAYYHVKIITPQNLSADSRTIHVKIQK